MESVDGSGTVLTFRISDPADGYSVSLDNPTVVSTGTGDGGLLINIDSVGIFNIVPFGASAVQLDAPTPLIGLSGVLGFKFGEALTNTTYLELFANNTTSKVVDITSIELSGTVLTIGMDTNAFGDGTGGAYSTSGVGRVFTLVGLTEVEVADLNGQELLITGITGAGPYYVTADSTHAAYGPTGATGAQASYILNSSYLRSVRGPLTLIGSAGGVGGIFTDPSYPLLMIGFGGAAQPLVNTTDTLYGLSIGWDIGGSGTTPGGNWTPSSGDGDFVAVTIKPRIEQTGTANGNYTILEIAALEAAVLGTKNFLLNCKTGPSQTNLTSKFSVDNRGTTVQYEANGEQWIHGSTTEEITLDIGNPFTDSSTNLLPSNSIIEAVTARITTGITGAANPTEWAVGDATTPERFTSYDMVLTLGETQVGLNQANGATGAAGPVQSSADVVRITLDQIPDAGAVRVTVFYRQFVAPTS